MDLNREGLSPDRFGLQTVRKFKEAAWTQNMMAIDGTSQTIARASKSEIIDKIVSHGIRSYTPHITWALATRFLFKSAIKTFMMLILISQLFPFKKKMKEAWALNEALKTRFLRLPLSVRAGRGVTMVMHGHAFFNKNRCSIPWTNISVIGCWSALLSRECQ